MPRANASRGAAAERWALPASQARSRELRRRLVEAGERVFAREGYEGARLADIAAEAGCSVGAVYFRFKDKDALFFAIAEAFAEESGRTFADLLADVASLPQAEVVRMFVTEMARVHQEHRGLLRAIVEHGFAHPLAMEIVFRVRDQVADRLEATLYGDASPGASLPVRVMTQMVYGFLLTATLNERAPTRGDPAAVAELADACCAYLTGRTE